jgi:hypothetical protein
MRSLLDPAAVLLSAVLLLAQPLPPLLAVLYSYGDCTYQYARPSPAAASTAAAEII